MERTGGRYKKKAHTVTWKEQDWGCRGGSEVKHTCTALGEDPDLTPDTH